MTNKFDVFIKSLLIILSGILLGFSNELNGILAWFFSIPGLWVVSNETPSKCANYGALSGIFTGAILFTGIIPFGFLYYLLLILYCSLNGALICRTLSFLDKKTNLIWKPFLLPIIWVSFEYLRTLTSFSFPLSLGNSQVEFKQLLQIASLTGVYGISFIVIWGNSTLFYLLYRHRSYKVYLSVILFLLTFALSIYWGQKSIETRQTDSGRDKYGMEIAIVQGSIPIWVYRKEKGNERFGRYIVNKYISLTKAIAHSKPELIIWPEVPVNKYIMEDENYRTKVINFIKKHKISMLIGAPERDKSSISFNSAFLINAKGELVGIYRKRKIIPIIENYTPSMPQRLLKLSSFTIGVGICFDTLYPEVLRSQVNKGAEMLVTLANDAGFRTSILALLHSREAILRAVENRRFVVRCAQSGISMIINPHGKILKKTKLFETTTLKGTVYLSKELTFYTKYGDLLCIFCIMILMFLFLKSFIDLKKSQINI